MTPAQRFSVRLIRLMIEEGRLLTEYLPPSFNCSEIRSYVPHAHDELTGEPAETWMRVCLDGEILVPYVDKTQPPGPLDFRWPTTAHARLAVIARIDGMLADST